jgi:Protein of unknown function (DUF3575)
MKKIIALFFIALATFSAKAQSSDEKPFRLLLKANLYALATQRYGLQAEIPLAQKWSVTTEARFLRQDWHVQGGEIFPTLHDAKGFNSITALRYYFRPLAKNRFFLGPEYRYRKSNFSTYQLHKTHHQIGAIFGWQRFWGQHFLTDAGLAFNRDFIYTETYDKSFTRNERNANLHLDILIGYRF